LSFIPIRRRRKRRLGWNVSSSTFASECNPAPIGGLPLKRVGILTFHRCINYGAYWQARCLSQHFQEAGHQVELLDYRCLRYFLGEVRHALRPQRPAPKTDVFRLLMKTLRFLSAQQCLQRTSLFSMSTPPDFSHLDLLVVGSDEVWNLAHVHLGGVPLFFGETLRPKKLVSYAASFGSYNAAEGLPEVFAQRLRRFDHISVRDENSRQLATSGYGREVPLVLDPCLQFKPTASHSRSFSPSDYLLVYGKNFDLQIATHARAWAQARGLRIISIGYRNDWADESVLSAGPDDFVNAFRGASAVVTSYFHGCVFSLRFDKPFAVQLSHYRANKIRGLLSSVNSPHRIVTSQSPERLDELLSSPIEAAVMTNIAEQRRLSDEFLHGCLQPVREARPASGALISKVAG
jgi:hypothetical protein